MRRTITDFHTDDEGHWVAELDCAHDQHVRHDPPMLERPWVLSAEGRADKIGEVLDCVLCDRREWPQGLDRYRVTDEFDEDTVPTGLLKNHSTKSGVWGRLVVTAGRVRYMTEGDGAPIELDQSNPGTIVPEVRHRVELAAGSRFRVEFYRRQRPSKP